MKRLLVLSLLVLTGCVTQVSLIDPAGKISKLDVDPISKGLSGVVDGKSYKGNYVTNQGSGFATGQTFGKKPTFSTAQYVSNGSAGQAMLFSADGANIQCEFSYQGLTVLGQCQGSSGTPYLMTTNPPT